MHALRKQSADKDEPKTALRPERTPAHDALMQEIAADARDLPESFLRTSVVPEGGE